jgi:hypothetical protein
MGALIIGAQPADMPRRFFGRPDIVLKRQGQPARAFIELNAPAKSADPERWKDAHGKGQYERLKELGTWTTSNFTGFHLSNRGNAAGEVIILLS